MSRWFFAAFVLMGLLFGSRRAFAQPPGSVAAKKTIRKDYDLIAHLSTKDGFEERIAQAAPDFTSTYTDGSKSSAADWVNTGREAIASFAPSFEDHLVIVSFAWRDGKAIVAVDDDVKTRLLKWGLSNPFEDQSVTRDTWGRIGKKWMRLSEVWLSERTWINGQLQK